MVAIPRDAYRVYRNGNPIGLSPQTACPTAGRFVSKRGRFSRLSPAISRIPPSHHGLHDLARKQLVRGAIEGGTEGFLQTLILL
jgi:hypothetical protein